MQHRTRIVAALAILAVAASACNLPLTPVPGRTPGTATGTGSAAPGIPNTGGSATIQISVRKAGRYGSILVDGSGRTLYASMKDGVNTPTCYGLCAKLWPPYIAASKTISSASGVPFNRIGTVIRNGGRMQVVYNGHPLYYFARDEVPGDTKGEGRAGAWFILSPAGDLIEK